MFEKFLRMFKTRTKNPRLEKRCKTGKRKKSCKCYKDGKSMSCKNHVFKDLNKLMKTHIF